MMPSNVTAVGRIVSFKEEDGSYEYEWDGKVVMGKEKGIESIIAATGYDFGEKEHST